MHNQTLGRKGEDQAIIYLQNKGYEILATNWRAGHKEIDIIARMANAIVFVEVKTRQTAAFGYPEEFVSIAKQQKVAAAAEEWLLQNQSTPEYRFDVIAILHEKHKTTIRHIEDAF
jgi:putative endonuclease